VLKKIKEWWQDFISTPCNCGRKPVVICKTYDDKTVYMCSECLRAIRFREKDLFKSILPYGSYK
jgi:hypothetical protein